MYQLWTGIGGRCAYSWSRALGETGAKRCGIQTGPYFATRERLGTRLPLERKDGEWMIKGGATKVVNINFGNSKPQQPAFFHSLFSITIPIISMN